MSQKAKEAALIPKGMRMMEDEERQEMLAALESNKAEIEGQIQASLPTKQRHGSRQGSARMQ